MGLGFDGNRELVVREGAGMPEPAAKPHAQAVVADDRARRRKGDQPITRDHLDTVVRAVPLTIERHAGRPAGQEREMPASAAVTRADSHGHLQSAS